ncbi:unnamed protein product [Clavelina lepadiformis]|uniref:RRM domain-containing protein n=1 Tax=Clavelina lepadiformis TaxID=159417 RepID=A0ABP0GDY3_CLALP
MAAVVDAVVNGDEESTQVLRHPVPPVLTHQQQEALQKAKKYAMQESVKYVLQKQESQAKLAIQNVVAGMTVPGVVNETMYLQKQQALVLMCRTYIGSIYYDLKEEVIRNSFSPFGPFKSVNMSFDPITGKHKGFAFIEYECPEAAQLALEQMGGVMLGGRAIKVGRPANMPQSHPVIDLLLEESKMAKRIYVSSVHTDLNTEDLKSVFSAFGNILSCTLVHDPLTGKHKGYGFIEYDTLQSANDAVASMNLFDLGGQYLRVGKAIAPAGVTIPAGSSFNNNPTTIPGAGLAVTQLAQSQITNTPISPVIPPPGIATPTLAGRLNIPPPGIAIPTSIAKTSANISDPLNKVKETMELPNTLSAQEDVKLSGVQARHMVMQKLMRKEESNVMVLCNMVDVEDIDEDLESEVTEECGKFGSVNRVIIYQEKQGEEDDAAVLVKIFVEFTNADFCSRAVDALNGRWFGGRKIGASIYSQAKFSANDLSG